MSEQPFVSVIVPVYNDAAGLADTLGALAAQDFPSDNFEILVVDNGSTDGTLDMGTEFADRFPRLVRVVVEDQIRGSYAARNRGIEEARGRIISFVDANMTMKRDWLRKVATIFETGQADYVGCRVRQYATVKNAASLYNILTSFSIKTDMAVSHYAPTCCLSVRREVFDRIGVFDGRLESGGDWEFGNRAWDAKCRFYYAGGVLIYHPARGSLKAILKKAMRIGRGGQGQLSSLYPDRYGYFRWRYLRVRAYIPPPPWRIKRQFRCGYSFEPSTVFQFVLIQTALKYTMLVGFVQGKIYYLLGRYGTDAK